MRRSVKAVGRAVQEVALAGSGRTRPWLVTLTYRNVEDWRPRHVSEALQCIRRWAERRGFVVPYVWVAELQKRGAVHYHVVVWLPARLAMPKPDKQGWWRHGMSNVVRATKPVGYLLKYSSKGESAGEFPRGLRLCGYGGLNDRARQVRYWLCLPTWLVQRARDLQRVTRLPGGVWLLEGTGELARSEWEFVRFDTRDKASGFRRRIVCEPHSPEWCARGVVGMDDAGRWWQGNGADALPTRLQRI